MSIPLRLLDSEKPAIIFPVAGQIHPRLSSSISGTCAASGRGGSVFAGVGGGIAGAGEARGSGVTAATAGGGGAPCWHCARARSAYGTLTPLGALLHLAGLTR